MSLDNELTKSFEQFFKKALSDFSQLGKKHNISTSQTIILQILNKQGPQKISELAQKMDITSSAITSLSETLIKSGFVTRERCEDDRRIVRLILTSEGKEISNTLLEQRSEMIINLHKKLTPQEVHILNELYKKMM
jgi:DNA-binding MarR family transcriptional regulator